jgi:hypothetical protein
MKNNRPERYAHYFFIFTIYKPGDQGPTAFQLGIKIVPYLNDVMSTFFTVTFWSLETPH